MNEYHFYDILSGFTGRPWSGLRTRKANISLYDANSDYLKKLIKTYPLQGDGLAYMRKHFLACSMFEIENELWQNIYD